MCRYDVVMGYGTQGDVMGYGTQGDVMGVWNTG